MPRKNNGPRLEWRAERDVYEIVWFESGRRKRVSTGTGSLSIAQRAFEKHLASLSGRSSNTNPEKRPIGEVIAAYVADKMDDIIGKETLAFNIDALTPFWANKPVSAITEQACRDYCKERGVAASTAGRELSVLQAACNHEFRKGRLDRPIHVWMPKRQRKPERFLTRSEVARLLWATRGHHQFKHVRLFILMGIYTGARKTAICELQWKQVDLQGEFIRFQGEGPATKKGRATIPMARHLKTFLAIRKRRALTEYVIESRGDKVGNIKKGFRECAIRAGFYEIKGNKKRATITPHVLRHTCASWMAQEGVSLFEIAKYLGHSSTRMVEQVYGHHHPDFMKAAKKSFE